MGESLLKEQPPPSQVIKNIDDHPSRDQNEKPTPGNELTKEQIQKVEHILKVAQQETPGVVSDQDRVRYLTYLQRDCSPEERDAAIAKLPDHLKKKKEFLEEYKGEVEASFTVEGELIPEGKRLVEDYQDMSGEERKAASEKLKDIIRERTREQKSFEELLQESPHFSENGQLTPQAQEHFVAFQAAAPLEKTGLKKELLQQLRKLEAAEKRCEGFYKAASFCYERGNYSGGEVFLSAIIRICDRYQDSPRMQVIRGWNTRDLANMRDHTEKQKEIQELNLLRDGATQSGDIETALDYAQAASESADHFLRYTTNRNGETVDRKPEYKTDHLRDLANTSANELSYLLAVKEEEERKKKEREVLEKKFMSDYSTSQDGLVHATQAGVLEEETRKKHSDKRTDEGDLISTTYVDNEDIEERFVTEEDFNEKTTEQEQEIAVDFQRNNDFDRLDKIRKAPEVNTGVTFGKEDIQDIKQLERLMGKKTENMVDKFVGRAEMSSDVSGEALEEFQENMQSSIDSGELGRDFTQETRQDGLDVVRFGDDFRRSQRELGEFLLDHSAEEKEEGDGKITNLAEAVKQQRQQEGIRQAA